MSAPLDTTQEPVIEDFGNARQTEPMQAATTTDTPQRRNTLKKRSSVRAGREGHTSRASSRSRSRSRSRAGSIRSVQMDSEAMVNKNSIFYTPVPTKGSPTEILVNRFNAWRRVLKDFITYFKEVQSHYEARAKGIAKLTNTLNVAAQPPEFLGSGGILETNVVLRDFHKEAITITESAAKIESEIIRVLTDLRSDLAIKIKEIKGLSGDFKNNIDKEKDYVRKEITKLQEQLNELESKGVAAKDPYLQRLVIEKQIKKYLGEENYLHRAHLNLESSGRELEKIVVIQIQKAYAAYIKIITREGQELLDLADRLTNSTLRVSPEYEWASFVERDPEMVKPAENLRQLEQIEYPGHKHPGVLEIKTGTLERKSKYLKSFTPGFYVLTATHLHEFKSADRLRDPTPVLSLALADSSLGKHTEEPSAISHKFVVRGRQTGGMHRGHSWVFRAETHQAMMEWWNAIYKLTAASTVERNDFIVRSTSQRTAKPTHVDTRHSSDTEGLENDEADEVPYSGQPSVVDHQDGYMEPPHRPEAGRFDSDVSIDNRNATRAMTPESDDERYKVAAAAAMAGTGYYYGRHHNRDNSIDQTRETYRDETHQPFAQRHQDQVAYGQTQYGSPTLDQVPSGNVSQYGAYDHGTPDQVAYTGQSAPHTTQENNYNFVPMVIPASTGHNTAPQEGQDQSGINRSDTVATKSSIPADRIIPFEEQRAAPPNPDHQYHVQTSESVHLTAATSPTRPPINQISSTYPEPGTTPPSEYDGRTGNAYVVGGTLPPAHGHEDNIGPDPAVRLDRNPNLDGTSSLPSATPLTGGHADQPGSAVPRTVLDATLGGPRLHRPPSLRKESATETISDLHVPGQYPKSRNEVPKASDA